MRYECGVCGSNDPQRYMRCNHPGCHDGRDRCRHGVMVGKPCAACALEASHRPRADDGNSYRYHANGLPAGGDRPVQSPRFTRSAEEELRLSHERFGQRVIMFALGAGAVMALSSDREVFITGIAAVIAAGVSGAALAIASALHRPK